MRQNLRIFELERQVGELKGLVEAYVTQPDDRRHEPCARWRRDGVRMEDRLELKLEYASRAGKTRIEFEENGMRCEADLDHMILRTFRPGSAEVLEATLTRETELIPVLKTTPVHATDDAPQGITPTPPGGGGAPEMVPTMTTPTGGAWRLAPVQIAPTVAMRTLTRSMCLEAPSELAYERDVFETVLGYYDRMYSGCRMIRQHRNPIGASASAAATTPPSQQRAPSAAMARLESSRGLVTPAALRVDRIDHYESAETRRRFADKRRELEAQGRPTDEIWVFHGTPHDDNVPSIMEYGFRVGGVDAPLQHGRVLGTGVYCAVGPALPSHYARGTRKLILCAAMRGKTAAAPRATVRAAMAANRAAAMAAHQRRGLGTRAAASAAAAAARTTTATTTTTRPPLSVPTLPWTDPSVDSWSCDANDVVVFRDPAQLLPVYVVHLPPGVGRPGRAVASLSQQRQQQPRRPPATTTRVVVPPPRAPPVLVARTTYRCASCGCRLTPKSAQVCSGCRRATYCGPTCQSADWSTHKLACTPPTASQQNVPNATPQVPRAPAEGGSSSETMVTTTPVPAARATASPLAAQQHHPTPATSSADVDRARAAPTAPPSESRLTCALFGHRSDTCWAGAIFD
mmetsp:Transcript_9561/g.39034  ORF Transcript_9561/g.39034 Transcript_9561/m.39034 type:complete len:630 (-) Transcript_9561:195-2084(-)